MGNCEVAPSPVHLFGDLSIYVSKVTFQHVRSSKLPCVRKMLFDKRIFSNTDVILTFRNPQKTNTQSDLGFLDCSSLWCADQVSFFFPDISNDMFLLACLHVLLSVSCFSIKTKVLAFLSFI